MRNTTTPKGTRLAHRIGLQRRAAECSYWVLGLAVLSSCTLIQERYALPVDAQTSATIMQTLQEREATVSSLKGLFHADIKGKGMAFAQSLQGSLFYQRPDQFRIKGFTQFGGLVFDFTLSGNLYTLRVTDQPRPIIGGGDNFQKLGELRLPVLLSMRAIKVLLGKLPRPDATFVTVQKEDDTYSYDIVPDPGTHTSSFFQRIVIDQRSLHVQRLDYMNTEGESVMSIHLSDFRRVSDGSQVDTIVLPFAVQAEDHHEAGSLELEFLEIIANEPLDPQVFPLAAF